MPTETVDVVIIGSGISGVSCALNLVDQLTTLATQADNEGIYRNQKFFKIIVMEAREFCSGATGKSGGSKYLTPAHESG